MIIEAKDVSIRYILGDFKDIGIKEYVLRKSNGITTYGNSGRWTAYRSHWNAGTCLGSLAATARANPRS